MSGTFAVATTMTKAEGYSTNVSTILLEITATSREEAIGIAHEESVRQFPNHQIFHTCCIEIKGLPTAAVP